MVECSTVTVSRPFTASRVGIVDCSVGTAEVVGGSEVPVTVTVRNDNRVAAEVTVQLRSPNQVEWGTITANVPAGGTKDVTATLRFGGLPPGEYRIEARLTNRQQSQQTASLVWGGR